MEKRLFLYSDCLISSGSSEKNVKKKHSIPIEAFLLSHCMLLRSKIKKNKANYAKKYAVLTNQPIKNEQTDGRTQSLVNVQKSKKTLKNTGIRKRE